MVTRLSLKAKRKCPARSGNQKLNAHWPKSQYENKKETKATPAAISVSLVRISAVVIILVKNLFSYLPLVSIIASILYINKLYCSNIQAMSNTDHYSTVYVSTTRITQHFDKVTG